jgi:hypothetical protein
LERGLKPQNAAIMGLWRGFAAKKRAQRHGKIAAHELISVALRYITQIFQNNGYRRETISSSRKTSTENLQARPTV